MNPIVTAECARCLGCKKPSCVSACPAHTDIPSMIKAAKCGDYELAKQIVGHPFGGVCGYVCPHELQCKGACVLNAKGSPVCGGVVEKEIFDQGYYKLSRLGNALEGVTVAVVGGGVSGVTFAAKCYEQGASVTVFEQKELLHTLKSIPQFRLPKSVVENAANCFVGTDVQVKIQTVTEADVIELSKRFDVVYLAFGSTVSREIGVNGQELATDADTFLRGDAFGNVIVVGGGNTAMDCARLNAFRGGKSTILYRRSIADMPAFKTEIEQTEAMGVDFVCATAPVEVKKVDGQIVVTCADTIFDGRKSLRLGDERREYVCDVLVAAVGNFPSVYIGENKRLPIDEQGLVFGNVYGGGDAAGGSLVSTAVGHAKRAFGAVIKRFGR